MKGGTSSLDHSVFSVPTRYRHVPIDQLDVPRSLLSLLKQRGFSELGDIDSISHIEFRRYFRGHPSPTEVLLSVERAIQNLTTLRTMANSQKEALPPTGVNHETDEIQFSTDSPNDLAEIQQSLPIYIPVHNRGESIGAYDLSARLRNICNNAGIQLLGQLHGKTFAELGKLRNCGKKTLDELEALVRSMQIGSFEPSLEPPPLVPRLDPDILRVPVPLQELVLEELPLSVRLASVLRLCGYGKLGQLQTVNVNDLLRVKNCGRRSIRELRELLARAEAGEFTVGTTAGFDDALVIIIRSIDNGVQKLGDRDGEILRQRLFGNQGEPRTLDDVGNEFGMTRERVRQIVKGSFEKIRRGGGPVLKRAMTAIAADCTANVVPLTPPLLLERLANKNGVSAWPAPFYVQALGQMAPSIPTWTSGVIREATNDSQTDEIHVALEDYLRGCTARPTAKEVFDHLRPQSEFKALSVPTFFTILRRAKRILVEFPRADEPRLRLRRLRLFDITMPVLSDSTAPLTPEEIIERGRSRFGIDAVMITERTAENALVAHPDIFRLGPRSFGLRKHFASSERDWLSFRDNFAMLLRKDKRPISTIEVCDKQSIALPPNVNSYELAEILREDDRFIDLGRHLFALAKWGLEEREHIKDLLPRIFAQADRPLAVSEIYERLTKLRSASFPGITNILRHHPEIRALGFDHYGLRDWGDSRNVFFVSKQSIVERAVRRSDPPIRFDALCEIFKVPVEGAIADTLWKSCAKSEKLRRAPDHQSSDTLLMHKAVSLEQALASISRALGKPAFAYELEWELGARFGELFDKVRLQQLTERLDKSSRFLQNAEGAFFLDADLDLGELDVEAIRAAAAKVIREEQEILSSDELLERLETQGFDLEEMTRGILASVLRGSESLEEVGNQRFRAK